METIGLKVGVPLRVQRAGRTLTIINHPFLDWTKIYNNGVGSAASGYLVVGFDRSPSAASYDAVVPPLQVATIPVPETVSVVTILWPNEYVASPGLSAGIGIGIGWTDCDPAAALVSADMALPLLNGTGLRFTTWLDYNGAAWAPGRMAPILDQGIGGGYNPSMRPFTAPSRAVTKTGVLVAATLTNLTGLTAIGTGPGQGSPLLKRLLLSVSGAGLVVIGTNGLTVGSPGAQEVVRVNAAAAGVLPLIDFGEGLDLNFYATAGVWRYYASTAITVDITAILG